MKESRLYKLPRVQQGLVAAVATIFLAGLSFGQGGQMSILLEKTPAEGGTLRPQAGVHSFGFDMEVGLTAVPSPGYRFAYWLGNVSNAASSTTTVHVNGPGIIVAVFTKDEFAFEEITDVIPGAPLGGLIQSAGAVGGGGVGGGIGGQRPDYDYPGWPEPPEPEEVEFPVPEIPEPSALLLLAAGAAAVFRRRHTLPVRG